MLPVYVRITVDEQRVEFSLKGECLPDKWNSHSGRMVGTKEDARSFKTYIASMQGQIHAAYHKLLSVKTEVTALAIRNTLTGTGERPYLLREIFKHHNEHFLELVGKEFAFGTYKKYKTGLNSLQTFLKWHYKLPDISVKDIRHEFLTNFEFYLKSI